MQHDKESPFEDSSGKQRVDDPTMPERGDKGFLASLKKIGFSVWLTVMIIGGALAFLTALFLL